MNTSDNKLTRKERTREKLKEAALVVLDRDGYHDMRITDVCSEAGVAAGTFYIHFDDKTELAIEVVKQGLRENERYIFSGPFFEDHYDAIFDANRRYIETFKSAGKLNRVLAQLIDAVPEMREFWEESSSRIAHSLATSLAKRCPASEGHELDRLFVAHAAQGMADSLSLQYFAWQTEDVVKSAQGIDALAEKISVLWHRLFYGCDPDPSKLVHASGILSMSLNNT